MLNLEIANTLAIIGGFSFGGTIAYEMACQLIQHHEEVAMVMLLDTFPWVPKRMASSTQLYSTNLEWLQQDAQKLLVSKLYQMNYFLPK